MIACVFFARNAAMSFNRIVDRTYDKNNPRTKDRDLPSGRMKVSSAYIFLAANIVLFVTTTWFLNFLCFCLSPLALAIILSYSLTKRFTFLSHFVLGLGLSIAPTGAYIAATAHFGILPLLYSAAVLFWVSGFDIIYALSDISFDRQQGLYSIPARFGVKNSLIISIALHLIALGFIFIAGIMNHNGLLFWMGFGLFTLFLFYQHYIVKPSNLSRINFAFGTMNGISGLVLMLFFILDFYFLYGNEADFMNLY